MDVIPSRMPYLLKVVVGLITCCMVGFGLYTSSLSAPSSTEALEELSAEEKHNLVKQGVEQYKLGNHEIAQKDLELAKTEFPENYAVPYYLGLIYLEQGQRTAAIAQWRQYVEMDPKSENASRIRKNLTILLREEARDSAKLAVANEASLIDTQADENTVAISAFNNLGSDDIGPLGKGMAALLIHDLSQVPDLQVVERVRLQALLREMKLGTSGLVSAQTAPKVGKLLKAKHVTSGSLADLEKESLQIASDVMDTEQMASIGAQEAQGELKQFYDLEKQLACQIIEDLGKKCDAAPAAFHKIHTKSMPALVSYSEGLNYFDEEKYDEARAKFQKALDEDPKFALATAALLATPTSAMISMSKAQMISSASSSGPSSAASGTAVASSSTTGVTTAASAAGSTVGITPTTAAIAGAAAVGGGAALAGGGDDGGNGDEDNGGGLSGEWTGIWRDSAGGQGNVTLNLTQTGSAISGNVSIPGDECLPAGNVSGTVSGNNVNMTIQSGGEAVTVDATVDTTTSPMALSGNWNYETSSLGCDGDSGDFSAEATGSAIIGW